jgi:hypothetical protein
VDVHLWLVSFGPLGKQIGKQSRCRLTTVRVPAGHASLATTDRYARIARNDLAGAAAQLNSYISRTRGGLGPTSEDRDNDVD